MQANESPTESLTRLRQGLLKLHRDLIHSERVVYEQSTGVIPSGAAFLDLLTQDPWFEWLRPISRKIAEIDEALADREKAVTADDLAVFRRDIRGLMAPDAAAVGFARNYFEAIQRDPDVALAHAALRALV